MSLKIPFYNELSINITMMEVNINKIYFCERQNCKTNIYKSKKNAVVGIDNYLSLSSNLDG